MFLVRFAERLGGFIADHLAGQALAWDPLTIMDPPFYMSKTLQEHRNKCAAGGDKTK